MHHLRPCAAMYDLAGEALSIKVDDTLHRLLHLPATPGTSVPWGSIIPEWPLALGDLARGCDAARPVCCWQLESPDGEPVCAVMSLGPAIGLDDGPDVAPDVAPDAVQHDGDERIPGNSNARQAPDSAGQGRRNLMVQLVRTPEQLPRRSVQAALLRGLSHDFGNALASIMGFAEIARTRPVDDPLLARSLDNVLKGCAQALSLMDRARAMAGRQSPSFQVCDLEALVETWCGELMSGNDAVGQALVWHARTNGGAADCRRALFKRVRMRRSPPPCDLPPWSFVATRHCCNVPSSRLSTMPATLPKLAKRLVAYMCDCSPMVPRRDVMQGGAVLPCRTAGRDSRLRTSSVSVTRIAMQVAHAKDAETVSPLRVASCEPLAVPWRSPPFPAGGRWSTFCCHPQREATGCCQGRVPLGRLHGQSADCR